MTLLLQKYLRDGGDPDALLASHTVKAKRHPAHPHLVLFKYGIEAPFMNPLVRECRGIILDESRDWAVVSRAFDKFGNDGEGYVPEIDWSAARVQEKLDGSLCVLYHHADAWHVATSGTPDAGGEVQQAGLRAEYQEKFGKTFAGYFWDTFYGQGGRLPDGFEHLCFAFELTGPANRVVVVHEKPSLTLLAVRARETGNQFWPDELAPLVGIPAVRSFPLSTMAEVIASFASISPLSQEGYVVVDGAFNRVKLKHPGYVALHHAKDGMGPKAFVEIARAGETSEVLTAFPEFKPLLDVAREKYLALVERASADYSRLASIETQKDFAAEALKTPYSAALFQARKGTPVADFLRTVAVEKVMTWMEAA